MDTVISGPVVSRTAGFCSKCATLIPPDTNMYIERYGPEKSNWNRVCTICITPFLDEISQGTTSVEPPVSPKPLPYIVVRAASGYEVWDFAGSVHYTTRNERKADGVCEYLNLRTTVE